MPRRKVKAKRTNGRPKKITPELIELFKEIIAEGNYKITAARIAGIAESTMYLWIQWGEARADGQKHDDGKPIDEIYQDFYEAIKAAEAEAERARVKSIKRAGLENWQANAWWLERMHPDRWGRRDKITADLNHSGQITNKVINLDYMSDAELKAELAKLEGKK